MEANWKLFYQLEDIVLNGSDEEVKKVLLQFDAKDFIKMPIIDALVAAKRMALLRFVFDQGVPFTYDDERGGSTLHIACGAGGDLQYVKFLVENAISTDIHKKSEPWGDTPLNLAYSYEHYDIVEYFRQKFGDKHVALPPEDVKVILDRWSDIRKFENNYSARIEQQNKELKKELKDIREQLNKN
jgi:hypothetical protein